MNNFLQFELWKDCNNKCTFCFNNNAATARQAKLERLNFILNEIDNPRYKNIRRIGFIGGELFDGQMDAELLTLFTQILRKAYTFPHIEKICIATALLYTDLTQLLTISNLFNKDNLLLICTSWDTFGRFHTPEHLALWERNIEALHKQTPTQQIHVEIIPTQHHITAVLNGGFNITDFKHKYGVSVDYCTPCAGFVYKDMAEFEAHVPGFFPKRSDFIKFLYKVYSESQATPDMFTNYENMSTLLWMELNGKYQLVEGYRGPVDGKTIDPNYPLPTMHAETSEYIDSKVRMRKDVVDVWNCVNME